MKVSKLFLAVVPVILAGALAGCSDSNRSPDVTDNIRKSLDQAGYKDVKVSEDRDKGVVTLTSEIATKSDKAQTESYHKYRAAYHGNPSAGPSNTQEEKQSAKP